MVVIVLHADGYYSWQLNQQLENKPRNLVLQSFAQSALSCWVAGAVPGEWKWKAVVAELLGLPFLPISMQRGLRERSAGPLLVCEVGTCRGSASQWLSWLHWTWSLKNWYQCCDLCRWRGCIWEPLCLFLHRLVKLCLDTDHPNWELRSSFQTQFISKKHVTFLPFRIRRISLNCEEWHGYYCQGYAAARLGPGNPGQDVVKNHHLQCSDR